MQTFELWDKKDYWRFQDRCILIKEFEIPVMYSEFVPDPPDNDPFPEYWNTVVEVHFINTKDGTCKKMSAAMMKDFYKYIHRMRDRKRYWRVMKYLKHMEAAK